MLYHREREHGHVENVFGEAITETDLTRALAPELDILARFLTTRAAPSRAMLIALLIPSSPVLNKALDASPHDEQAAASLAHITKLGELFTTLPEPAGQVVMVTKDGFLCWVPEGQATGI